VQLRALFDDPESLPGDTLARLLKFYKSMVVDGFAGDAVECPYCHRTFTRFLPFGFKYPVLTRLNVVGGGYRQNGLCPECFSSDRERLLFLYLQRATDVFVAPVKVLHVAPEPSLMQILSASPNIQYLSADILPGVGMQVVDVTQTGFADAEFDLIICNHVLEHIPNDLQAMRELFRILSPSGTAILQVPISLVLEGTYEDLTITSPDERAEAFGQRDHVRIYARDYASRLELAGFEATVYDPVSLFGKDLLLQHGCNVQENIYTARKPAPSLI
jgi:predicted SAM-dependent methyltransferase